jgi:Helix-hairpin-helix containing domain
VADIRSEPRPASDRNRWPASYWNAWPASSESARGIGFKTADAIAMKLGIEKSAMIRVRAGIS